MEIASESSMAKMPSITDESLLLSSLGRYIKNKIKPTSAQASGHQWLLRNDNTLLLLDPFIIYPLYNDIRLGTFHQHTYYPNYGGCIFCHLYADACVISVGLQPCKLGNNVWDYGCNCRAHKQYV